MEPENSNIYIYIYTRTGYRTLSNSCAPRELFVLAKAESERTKREPLFPNASADWNALGIRDRKTDPVISLRYLPANRENAAVASVEHGAVELKCM